MTGSPARAAAVVPGLVIAAAALLHVVAWQTEWGRTHLWGLHHAGFLPVWVRATLLAALATVAVPAVRVRAAVALNESRLPAIVVVPGVAAVAMVLFLTASVAHPIFGDATTRLAEVAAAEAPRLWPPRHANDTAVRHLLHHTVGDALGWEPATSYGAVSVAWGLLLVACACHLARQLGRDAVERVALAGGLVSGGYMLLFFGYIEAYSSVAALDTALLVSLIAYVRCRCRLWLPVLVLALLGLHHIFGLLPAPALVWAAAVRHGIPDRFPKKWRGRLAPLFGAGSVLAGWVLYQWVRPTSVVPVLVLYGHVPYRLFDLAHLADAANFFALAALPGAAAVAAALVLRRWEDRESSADTREGWILGLAAASSLALMFVSNPALGRLDWDLMSLHGPLWVAAGTHQLLRVLRRVGDAPAGSVLIVPAIGLFHAVGWVALQQDPDRAVTAILAMTEGDQHRAGHRALKLGVWLEDAGFGAAALDQYHRAVIDEPEFYLAHYNLGRVYDKLGNAQEAIDAYRQAAQLHPTFPTTFNNLGGLYHRLGRLQEAKEGYTKAAELDPEFVGVHANLGLVHYDLGEWTEAAASYERAVALDPDLEHAHFNLGASYSRLGRYRDAARALISHVRLRPDSAAGFLNLGDALARVGDRDRALEALTRYLELTPADDPYRDKALGYLRGTDPAPVD